jgi:hypothetical protein
MLMYKLWMIPIQYKYFLLLDYVHTVTFSSVFISSFVFSLQNACKHYQFTTEAVVYLIYWRYFHLDRVYRASKRFKGQKAFLKTLENDARVHMHSLIL